MASVLDSLLTRSLSTMGWADVSSQPESLASDLGSVDSQPLTFTDGFESISSQFSDMPELSSPFAEDPFGSFAADPLGSFAADPFESFANPFESFMADPFQSFGSEFLDPALADPFEFLPVSPFTAGPSLLDQTSGGFDAESGIGAKPTLPPGEG
jgi:hypothetical protein